MVGSKISLLFLSAAVLLVSAQQQPGRPVTTGRTRTFELLFRPPPQFPVLIPPPGAGGVSAIIQGILSPGAVGVPGTPGMITPSGQIVAPGVGPGIPGPGGAVVIGSPAQTN